MGFDEVVPIFGSVQIAGPTSEHVIEVLLGHRYRKEFLIGHRATRPEPLEMSFRRRVDRRVL
jgi:hypothetical protein